MDKANNDEGERRERIGGINFRYLREMRGNF
jgi:hypothetical protein